MIDNAVWPNAPRRVVAAMLALFGPTLPGLVSIAHAGDPNAGKTVFTAICSGCHTVQPGQSKVGPSLFGIVGRRTGEPSAFPYSPANQASNLIWDVGTLDMYIQAPHAIVPGTRMSYGGLKDDTKRDNLIAYLTTLK